MCNEYIDRCAGCAKFRSRSLRRIQSFLKSAWRQSVYYYYDKARNTPYFASWHLGDSLGVYCWRQCRYKRRFYKFHSRLSNITTGNRCRNIKTKRRRSDPVLWQKPLYQQKCQRGKAATQTTPQKNSIKQQLRTDLGRSVGVTTAIQLVWLTGLRAHLPIPRNGRVIKSTHI